ncbi:MAG: hypothetical protein EOP34_07350 [Rickettsiales bacterium]|nr:MAG: hypothetical protein EOP34_07350 [Rickettsiales bacterium]
MAVFIGRHYYIIAQKINKLKHFKYSLIVISIINNCYSQ